MQAVHIYLDMCVFLCFFFIPRAVHARFGLRTPPTSPCHACTTAQMPSHPPCLAHAHSREPRAPRAPCPPHHRFVSTPLPRVCVCVRACGALGELTRFACDNTQTHTHTHTHTRAIVICTARCPGCGCSCCTPQAPSAKNRRWWARASAARQYAVGSGATHRTQRERRRSNSGRCRRSHGTGVRLLFLIFFESRIPYVLQRGGSNCHDHPSTRAQWVL
jgi:hypothetical protein